MKAGDIVKIDGCDSVCLASDGKEALFMVRRKTGQWKWVKKPVKKTKKKAAAKK